MNEKGVVQYRKIVVWKSFLHDENTHLDNHRQSQILKKNLPNRQKRYAWVILSRLPSQDNLSSYGGSFLVPMKIGSHIDFRFETDITFNSSAND